MAPQPTGYAVALNAKQRAFVREYRQSKNATESAKKAGYSPNSAHAQGCRLLKHAEVKAAIDDAEAKAAEKCELDRAWVLERLAAEAEDQDNNGNARIRAVELIGRAVEGGIFKDKVDHGVEEKTLAQILAAASEKEG
jgi:phage terminase small subunit